MTRAGLLAEIERAHADLASALADLPADGMTAQADQLPGSPNPGGESARDGLTWTPKELMGHVAMWMRVAIKFIEEYRQNGAPTPLGLRDNAAIDEYNARGAASRRDQPLAVIRSEFDAAHTDLVAAIGPFTDADLIEPLPAPWDADTNLAFLIAINSSEHEPEHTAQVRAWLKAKKTTI